MAKEKPGTRQGTIDHSRSLAGMWVSVSEIAIGKLVGKRLHMGSMPNDKRSVQRTVECSGNWKLDTHTICGIVGTAYEETPVYSCKSDGIFLRGVPCLRTGVLKEWCNSDLTGMFDLIGRAHDGDLMRVSSSKLL
jgi:hypothetical protein